MKIEYNNLYTHFIFTTYNKTIGITKIKREEELILLLSKTEMVNRYLFIKIINLQQAVEILNKLNSDL